MITTCRFKIILHSINSNDFLNNSQVRKIVFLLVNDINSYKFFSLLALSIYCNKLYRINSDNLHSLSVLKDNDKLKFSVSYCKEQINA